MKKNEMTWRQSVPTESNKRYPEISSPKAKLAIVVNTKALKPKADKGNAVEVPRWSGKLNVPIATY